MTRPSIAARLARSASGAAIVEALCVLPVFALVLIAVPLLRELYTARQEALGAARACGFAHALGGCGELPEGCRSPWRDAAPAPGPESDVLAIVREHAGPGLALFDALPFLGDALAALLGDTIEARSTATVHRAGTSRAVHGAILLVCNEQPRDVLAIARETFCAHLPVLDCGGGS